MWKPSRPLRFLSCYLYLLWKVGHYLPSHFTRERTKYWSYPRSQNFRLVLFLILFKEKILVLNYFDTYIMIMSCSLTWVMQDDCETEQTWAQPMACSQTESIHGCGKVEAAQSCLILCSPMDCSPPGSSVHGISQARIQEWVAISFSRGPSRPRYWTQVFSIAGWFFTAEPPAGSWMWEWGINAVYRITRRFYGWMQPTGA